MKRRSFTAFLSSFALAPFITTAAHALTEARAKVLVDTLVADINKVIASGKSEGSMIKDFERIFARYSDTSYISAYALGVDARRATSGQKRAFSKAFQAYIAQSYGSRFREFIGGQLEVKGVRKVKSWYEVTALAKLKGQSPFEITFQVSDRTGKDLFFNLFIEGINLLLTERTEIGSLLDRNGGNIDNMIADLKKSG
ncbi:MAG: phospholipid transport system substrate-binding protein [Ascidiaceihabitans sp.]|jgi:phospholipid transport system substrate-binding protein